MNNVILLSEEKAAQFAILKKKSDADVMKIHQSLIDILIYYANTDSFEQSLYEKPARLQAERDKQLIEDYIRQYRPKLKGRI